MCRNEPCRTESYHAVEKRQLTPATKRVSHRGSLLKGVTVQGVLYQSMSNAKLTGWKKLGRKMCTSSRDDRNLENPVKQSRFKHWESFTRSELKLESVHQESPHSDIFRKRSTKPLLNQKHRQKYLTWAGEKKNWTVAQWSKFLFSDESKFCFSFGNQRLEEDWRGTESKLLEVQCEVSEVSDDLGCRDVCVLVHCVLSIPK